ncbi:MAG: DUF1566 domain-containing protein [Myxococcota bacterium]
MRSHPRRAPPLSLAAVAIATLLSGAAPPNRYSYLNGQTITVDNVTGLKWQRAHGGYGNYTEASGACANLNLGGEYASGWRVPRVKELATLVDVRTTSGPWIDTTAFTGTISSNYWTSTPAVGQSNYAWTVSFSDGTIGTTAYSTGTYYRCVHD